VSSKDWIGAQRAGALITRGLAELTRLACAAGGRRDTLAGLSVWAIWS